MVILSKQYCTALVDLLECNLFDVIRNDPSIDNIEWLADICGAYREMKAEAEKDGKTD